MYRVTLALLGLSLLSAASAGAGPIPNGSFSSLSSGWFDGSKLTCPEICERHGAVAEAEANTAPPVRRSYVCKVRQAESGPYVWLFGTQFDSRPACYTTNRDLAGEYSEVFYCLCVKRSSTSQRKRPRRAPPGNPG